jgi:hypothetical protein
MVASPALCSPTLVDLAPELLELTLAYLEPRDLVNFARTCRRANEYIRPSNQILWKAAFLHVFDHPRHAWALWTPTARAANQRREECWDWYRELRRRCNAFDAVCRADATARTNVEDIVTALLDVNQTASYLDVIGQSNVESLNLNFLNRLQQRASEFDRFVHDYQYGIDSISLPPESKAEHDRPITRSMLGRRVDVPVWASRFHVSFQI